jgi:hypothetical protein
MESEVWRREASRLLRVNDSIRKKAEEALVAADDDQSERIVLNETEQKLVDGLFKKSEIIDQLDELVKSDALNRGVEIIAEEGKKVYQIATNNITKETIEAMETLLATDSARWAAIDEEYAVSTVMGILLETHEAFIKCLFTCEPNTMGQIEKLVEHTASIFQSFTHIFEKFGPYFRCVVNTDISCEPAKMSADMLHHSRELKKETLALQKACTEWAGTKEDGQRTWRRCIWAWIVQRLLNYKTIILVMVRWISSICTLATGANAALTWQMGHQIFTWQNIRMLVESNGYYLPDAAAYMAGSLSTAPTWIAGLYNGVNYVGSSVASAFSGTQSWPSYLWQSVVQGMINVTLWPIAGVHSVWNETITQIGKLVGAIWGGTLSQLGFGPVFVTTLATLVAYPVIRIAVVDLLGRGIRGLISWIGLWKNKDDLKKFHDILMVEHRVLKGMELQGEFADAKRKRVSRRNKKKKENREEFHKRMSESPIIKNRKRF